MYGEVLDTVSIEGIPRGEEDKVFEGIQQKLEEIVCEIEAGSLPPNHPIIEDMYQLMGKINAGRDIASIKNDMVISQHYDPSQQQYSINASGETAAQSYEREITGENEIRRGLKEIKEKTSLFPVNSQTICDSMNTLGDEEWIRMFETRAKAIFGSIPKSSSVDPNSKEGLGER